MLGLRGRRGRREKWAVGGKGEAAVGGGEQTDQRRGMHGVINTTPKAPHQAEYVLEERGSPLVRPLWESFVGDLNPARDQQISSLSESGQMQQQKSGTSSWIVLTLLER